MKHTKQIETVIYGGAFNPPTLAHVAILRACYEYAEARSAEVWVMPSGNRFDKTIPVARTTRLAYVTAMIRDAARSSADTARVLTTELDRSVVVETIDTVHELKAKYPQRSFTFVFGADSTETMASWRGGEALLATLAMLVVEREGSRINPRAVHAQKLEVHTPPVSSTKVRQCLLEGSSIDGLVSPRVARLLV